MPGGDRTGPTGAGPRTGRSAGFCSGFRMPGYASPVPGVGLGRGFRGGNMGNNSSGRGRRWRNWFRATGLPGWMISFVTAAIYGNSTPFPVVEPELEKQILKHKADELESELDSIKKRLTELGMER